MLFRSIVPNDPTAAIAAAVAPVQAELDALKALVGAPTAPIVP